MYELLEETMNKRLTLMSLVLTGTLVTPLLNSTTAVAAPPTPAMP